MKKIILSVALFAASFTMTAQVGIGTTTPEGVLDVVSTNSGFFLPRVANTGAVTSPVNGMIIYDLSSNCLKSYSAGEWSDCFGQSPTEAVLAQIGNEADDPDAINSVVTIANLNTIIPTVTGILSTKETVYQNYIDGNPALFSSPATHAEVQAMADAISPTDVVGPAGKIWMDRNLGASRVATSSGDSAAYGSLYQWGRGTDGHQSRSSATTTIPSAGDDPGHGNFIVTGSGADWKTTANDNLWQGVNGINNPCPTGYRVPTEAEFSGLGITNAATAFSSPLKLPLARHRLNSDGSLYGAGRPYGTYWSSTVSGTYARDLNFSSSGADMNANQRAYGYSVRCIKD